MALTVGSSSIPSCAASVVDLERRESMASDVFARAKYFVAWASRKSASAPVRKSSMKYICGVRPGAASREGLAPLSSSPAAGRTRGI
jgi:hypothetical protein